jgi:hypothetical protein
MIEPNRSYLNLAQPNASECVAYDLRSQEISAQQVILHLWLSDWSARKIFIRRRLSQKAFFGFFFGVGSLAATKSKHPPDWAGEGGR